LSRGRLQTGCLIWGRAKSPHHVALPPPAIEPTVKLKEVTDSIPSHSISPIKDSNPKDLLSQFSGEPQIVESIAISQTPTPSREPTGLAVSGPASLSHPSTTDIIKGTYIGSLKSSVWKQTDRLLSSLIHPETCFSASHHTLFLPLPLLEYQFSSPSPSLSKQRFVEILRSLQATPGPQMNPPRFLFKFTKEAAEFNAKILADNNFDLDKIIRQQHPSQISYSSLFRSSLQLQELLCAHPLWIQLKDILDHGASFPLDEISDTDRKFDLTFHLNRGNHKSAMLYHQILQDIITEDIERGFALPLPVSVLHSLPKASLAPLGCVKQSMIDASGSRSFKHRMTHDQSFPLPSNLSVNLRVQNNKLPPIMYNFVLLRSIHYILSLRHRHPSTKIFICKFDIDAAYRQCSFSSKTAFESLTIFAGLLFVALQMTFGGAPCPSIWGVISETIMDIGNALLQNDFRIHSELYDSISDKLDAPLSLPDSVPFCKARELSVSVPPNDRGKVDIYIDDSIGIAPDLDDAPIRVICTIPLAIRSVSRPNSDLDVLPRKDIISLKKLCAEGQLCEIKTVLGWVINTHLLTIALPEHKVTDWLRDIDSILLAKQVNFKLLESLIGHLNHVACIFIPMRHFMGRLYRALYRSKARLEWTSLTTNELLDLSLHSEFLQYAKRGVLFNNVAFRKPTHIFRSDASEFGLRGYSILSGHAWRWEMPTDLRLRTSINSLEFISSVITIWFEIIHGFIQPENCLWSQTDSSSAAGWLHKSNFAEDRDEEIQLTTARRSSAASTASGSQEILITSLIPSLKTFKSAILTLFCY
jgi:hypothetical protein